MLGPSRPSRSAVALPIPSVVPVTIGNTADRAASFPNGLPAGYAQWWGASDQARMLPSKGILDRGEEAPMRELVRVVLDNGYEFWRPPTVPSVSSLQRKVKLAAAGSRCDAAWQCGPEALVELRLDPVLARMLVVVVTARDNLEAEALAAGADRLFVNSRASRTSCAAVAELVAAG